MTLSQQYLECRRQSLLSLQDTAEQLGLPVPQSVFAELDSLETRLRDLEGKDNDDH